MQCRFVDTGILDAFTNMAVDEALVLNCNSPVLRVYQWRPKAVSIGYSQNVLKEVDIGQCKEKNIGVVRRVTGGKAVFHDKELTYSFIVPEKLSLLSDGVVESYKEIAQALVHALKDIGINSNIEKQKDKVATPICFNSSNWYELLVNGRKISGSAQRRLDGMVLQHGPILLDFDYETNSRLFKGTGFDSLDNLKKRITSIKNETGRDIEVGKIKNSLKKGFEKIFAFEMVDSALTGKETRVAEKLKEGKYATDEWNTRNLVQIKQ